MLSLHHALVAHYLVATGVGLDFGAIYPMATSFTKPHSRTIGHLYEQILWFFKVKSTEITQRADVQEN